MKVRTHDGVAGGLGIREEIEKLLAVVCGTSISAVESPWISGVCVCLNAGSHTGRDAGATQARHTGKNAGGTQTRHAGRDAGGTLRHAGH